MVTKKTERILISISVPQVRDFIQPKHTVLGAQQDCFFRGLPFRNKADGGKPSLIWGQKMRIRPQCRVTTPQWAPGAGSGQRRKKKQIGGEIRTEK